MCLRGIGNHNLPHHCAPHTVLLSLTLYPLLSLVFHPVSQLYPQRHPPPPRVSPHVFIHLLKSAASHRWATLLTNYTTPRDGYSYRLYHLIVKAECNTELAERGASNR